MFKKILKIFLIFLLEFYFIPAQFLFAQVDCSKLTPADLNKPENCSIYQTKQDCQNNTCLINVGCQWDEKQQTCFSSKQIKPLEIQHYPNIPGYGTLSPETTPAEYIQYVFVFALWILGIVTMSMLIYAGVLWFVSGGDVNAKGQAIKIIQNIVIGLFLFLSSYLILNTLDPSLLTFKKNVVSTLNPIKLPKPDFCAKANILNCEDYNKMFGIGDRWAAMGGHQKLTTIMAYCNLNICDVNETCEWSETFFGTLFKLIGEIYKGGYCTAAGRKSTIPAGYCANNKDENCPQGTICNTGQPLQDTSYQYTGKASFYRCTPPAKQGEVCAEKEDCETGLICQISKLDFGTFASCVPETECQTSNSVECR